MLESLRGTLIDKEPSKAVIEIGGVGYKCAIPLNTYTKLPPINTQIFVYISQVIREDSNTLYGFLEKAERNLFETLITISGIGPKTGLAIIGHMDLQGFYHAITTADTRLLSKIPGIGKKTAERLVLEMRGKPQHRQKSPNMGSDGSLLTDAVSALMNLGYTPIDAQKAVQEAQKETKDCLDLGKIITAALHKIR
jgi:Holliday junction DNA helicase RuvA